LAKKRVTSIRAEGEQVADTQRETPTWRSRLGAGAAVVAAAGIFLATQAGMYLQTPGWSLTRFRAYYEHDQLGYLAIVTNWSQGQFQAFEPDTETGTNTYPRLYYEVVGFLARVLGLQPVVAWNVFGLLAQLALVAGLALLLIAFSRRWWTGLLAPLPFLVGTFAFVYGPDWFTTLDSHAVIWGPFGILHSLNGEAVSLSIACLALFGLGWLWLSPHSPRSRMIVTLGLSLIIGLLGNVQTYSFIATVYLLMAILAVLALVSGRHVLLAVASVALIPAVFLAGPAVSAVAGQLPTLVFGLLPTLPGIVVLVLRTRGALAMYLTAAVAGASPQVISTVTGLVNGDPFLLYRVASNSQLGVPATVGLVSGIAVIVPLGFILVAAVIRRRAFWAAYALGGATAWLLLATNDRWGANAEPYRLWMDSFFLIAATLLPMLVLVVRDLWGSSAPVPAGLDLPGRRAVPRWLVVAGVGVVAAIAAVSLTDWNRFFNADIVRALMVTDSDRDRVAAALAAESSAANPGTLLLVGPCLDPRVIKITSGVPVAYFHLGMAWPREYEAVRTIIGNSQVIDVDSARRANATQVLTDSRCPTDWGLAYADTLIPEQSRSYTADDGGPGALTLWSIRD
jgi:hypothetical protein